MFSNLIDVFSYNLIALGVLFAILFVTTAFAFAGRNGGDFLVGILRLVVSIFHSPLVYLRKAVQGIAGLGHQGDQELVHSRQYLLTKLMFTLQAILVIAAVAIVAMGLYRTWNTFIPPQHVREAISHLEHEMGVRAGELSSLDSSIKEMDSLWSFHKDSLIANYDKIRESNINSFAASMEAIVARGLLIQNNDFQKTLAGVRSNLDYWNTSNQKRQINNTRDELLRWVRGSRLADSTRTLLIDLTNTWHSWMISRTAIITGLGEKETRESIQPNYASSKDQATQIQVRLDNDRIELASWKQQEIYSPLAALWQIALTIVSFVTAVWLLGLAIEALWLAIHVAANVQRIREVADAREQASSKDASAP